MDHSTRRGTIVIVFAVSLTVLMGFAALVVDVGYQKVVGAQLQLAADAMSHAATQHLDGTEAGMEDAQAAAAALASFNTANGQAISFEENPTNSPDGVVVFGVYDFDSGSFTVDTLAEEVNAVQVNLRAGELTPFFSSLSFGIRSLAASGTSTTAQPLGGPAGAVECILPIALSSCTFDTYDEGEYNYVDFRLSGGGNPEDEIGWASLSGRPNANGVKALLSDCESEGEATVSDVVYLNNGTISSALSELADLVSDSDTSWDTDSWGRLPAQLPGSAISSGDYGNTWEGPVVIFDSGGCSNVKFNQSADIVGFSWGVVYDVVDKGSNKSVRMRIETMTDHDVGSAGGGEIDAGITFSAPPVFVR